MIDIISGQYPPEMTLDFVVRYLLWLNSSLKEIS